MNKAIRKKYLVFSFLPMLIFIFWIIYQANINADNFFIRHVQILPYGDKFGHLGLYGTLALLLNLSLGCKNIKCGSLKLQTGSLLVLCFAVMEEMTQGLLATRTLDIWDLMADAVGVTIAGWTCFRGR